MIFSGTALFSNPATTKVIDILLVAGGGGGGAVTGSRGTFTFTNAAGGGGAGGYLSKQIEITSASVLSVTIGDGGVGGCIDTTGNPCGFATNGNNSVITISSSIYSPSFTTIGGGAGGNYSSSGDINGGNGGSGGGNDGKGTAGQGFDGAISTFQGPGGGGGASQPGYRADSGNAGGGDGKQWYDGIYYAGGGGAGTETNPGPTNLGGQGGGGRGGYRIGLDTYQPNGTNGTINTGGGGGGKGRQQDSPGGGTFRGGNGGSGIAKIRYYGTGSIFSAGSSSFNATDGYTYYTFTSSVAFSGSF